MELKKTRSLAIIRVRSCRACDRRPSIQSSCLCFMFWLWEYPLSLNLTVLKSYTCVLGLNNKYALMPIGCLECIETFRARRRCRWPKPG